MLTLLSPTGTRPIAWNFFSWLIFTCIQWVAKIEQWHTRELRYNFIDLPKKLILKYPFMNYYIRMVCNQRTKSTEFILKSLKNKCSYRENCLQLKCGNCKVSELVIINTTSWSCRRTSRPSPLPSWSRWAFFPDFRIQRQNSWTSLGQSLKCFPPCYSQSSLPYGFYSPHPWAKVVWNWFLM